MAERRVSGFSGLQQAFDEVRFGAARTLNLRTSLPTASQAAERVEQWLRQHQALKSGEVLVITGRGNNSEGGVSVVREAAIRVFHELRRKHVVKEFTEHTAGSFVVALAPMSAASSAPARERAPLPPPASPPTLATLSQHTRQELRVLAERSLDSLGVHERGAFLEDEMLRLFGLLAKQIKPDEDREKGLRRVIAAAMNDLRLSTDTPPEAARQLSHSRADLASRRLTRLAPTSPLPDPSCRSRTTRSTP